MNAESQNDFILPPLPYYDSIAQAAAGISAAGFEVTVAELRKAKKEGAPGFRGSRVYPEQLVPWLTEWRQMGRDLDDGEKGSLERRKLEIECDRLELKLANERGELWKHDEVKARWLQHCRSVRQVLIAIPIGLAPRLAGHPVAEIQRLLAAAVDEALQKFRENPYGSGPFVCPHCRKTIEPDRDFQLKDSHGNEPLPHDAGTGTTGSGSRTLAPAEETPGADRAAGANGARAVGKIPGNGDTLRENGEGRPGDAGDASGNRRDPARQEGKRAEGEQGVSKGGKKDRKEAPEASAAGGAGKRGSAVRNLRGPAKR